MNQRAFIASELGKRGHRALLALTDWASYLILVGMVLVICVDVACRYFLGFSTQIAEEVASLGLVALMFVSLAGAFEDGQFLRVDALHSLLPEKLKALLEPIFHLIALAITAVYITYIGKLVINSFEKNIRSDTALGTPNYLTQTVMAIGLCALFIALAVGLVRSLSGQRAKEVCDD